MGVVLYGSLSGYEWLCAVLRLPKADMGCVLCVCGSLSSYVVPIASATVWTVCCVYSLGGCMGYVYVLASAAMLCL